MLRYRLPRAMSAVLTIALLLSGLLVLTSWAPADGGALVEPQDPLAEVSDSEEVTIEPTPTVPQPHGGWTRESVRAWVEKMGVPSAQLLTSPSAWSSFEMGEGVGGGIITPNDVNEVAVHQSDLAHMLGFNGTGVTVAIVDTGVDFAHPDLYNRTARVLDPSSPYYLHPMAHDASSLNDYLRFGEPGPQSWFVNTSFSATVIQVADGTRWVDWTDATTTLSWNVTGVAGLTAGEEVRVGFHPDEKLELLLNMRAGLILFHDAGAGGPFDSVMVDLDGDFDMGDEKRAFFNTAFGPAFDPEAELIFQDLTGDGIQDVSGGMVYFISDGAREIPYASRQIETLNFTWQTFTNDNSFDIWEGLDPAANLVPGDGNLTLIFGDLNEPDTFGSHGTWIASALAGQGRTGGFGGGPVLAGQAPGAKILAAGNNLAGADPLGFGIYTALIFAAEGYDGVPGTGDEAQIASNSWGSPGWTGWDWSSRFVDYISNVLADEAILYVFAAGNNGPGLGGRADPPGGASLLIAGGMENYFHRLDPWFAFGALDGGPNPSFGGTAEFSSRGPSALGRHHIDALASGASGYGADPLNDNPFVQNSGTTLNGNSSWILWSGTSLSAPNLAGVAALVYDAYASAHGSFPMASTAKGIIKNAADDAGQDPLLTGAGLANALRGVLIASEADGLTTSIDEWNPGDYRGTVYADYPNLLSAGGGDTTTVTLTNHRPALSLDVSIADAVLANTGNVSLTFTRAPFSGADEYLFNAAGFMAVDGTVLVPGNPSLWATADAIRVSLYISRQDMIDYTPQFRFRVYDWTDVNGNGASEGISEGNLMTQDMPTWLDLHGPNGYTFVYDPAARSHDGLYLRNDVFREATDPVSVHVVVDYFERTDWSWLSASAP
ncbi:MAG: S8 family serine peptidase, partial [bacterium]